MAKDGLFGKRQTIHTAQIVPSARTAPAPNASEILAVLNPELVALFGLNNRAIRKAAIDQELQGKCIKVGI